MSKSDIKPVPVFLRPYFARADKRGGCIFCLEPIPAAHYCGKCFHRMCPSPKCKELAAKAEIHTPEDCERMRPDRFEHHVGELLRVADLDGKDRAAEYLNPVLVSMYLALHARPNYKAKQSRVEETKCVMEWRDQGFPNMPAKLTMELLGQLPRPGSNFQALMSVLFSALIMLHDGSNDNVVQTFYTGYFFDQFRHLNAIASATPGMVEDEHRIMAQKTAAACRTMFLSTNPKKAGTPDPLAFDPIICVQTIIDDTASLPALFARIFSRPVAHSLVYVDLLVDEPVECAMYLGSTIKTDLELSQSILLHVYKSDAIDGGTPTMRVLQAHPIFYSVGQWFAGKLPASDMPLRATVDQEPSGAKRMEGKIELFDYVKQIDTLTRAGTSALERRNAYAKVTGIHLLDANVVPKFRCVWLEADLTH